MSTKETYPSQNTKRLKTPALVLLGNILDYYDFLLFAHLGYLIFSLFTNVNDEKQNHLLSIVLFSIIFVIRPLGGYLFGRISDLESRRTALSQSVLWAGIATFGLAFLPTYETIGILSTCLLIFLRILQGLSIGGEYPTAGTYLMETYPQQRGLLSGILSASSSIGGLIALGFAWMCLQDDAPSWLWRIAFLLGGLASIISYFLRKNLQHTPSQSSEMQRKTIYSYRIAIISTLLLGMVSSIFSWLPTIYSNFYLTKILHTSTEVGLAATLIAIVPSLFLKPLFGKISDYYEHFSYLFIASFLAIPLVLIGFYMIIQANIWGQIPLTLASACFIAPVHSVMNRLFVKEHRSRSVNLFFMLGAGIGGLTPSLCGFVVAKTSFHFFPAILCATVALIAALTFLYFSKYEKILLKL